MVDQPPPNQRQIQFTKFENATFDAQTVHMAGKAFLGCTFNRCTLIVSNVHFVCQGCHMVGCNWRVEYDVLWGDPNTRSRLRQLLDMIDGAPDARVS